MTDLDTTTQEVDESKSVEYGYRSGNVFLIDGSEEMFKERDGGSYFLQCLWMYQRILQQKLSMNKKDFMGMILFATNKSDPETPHIYTILKFNPVTKAICFDEVKLKVVTKHVNLITCNDNPLEKDNEERHKSRVIAKNYKDIHIKIQVVGLGPTFDYDIFYKELIDLAEKYPDRDCKQIQLTDLEENVLRKAFVTGHMDFKVNDKFKIKVTVQGFSTAYRYTPKVWIHKETNEILDKVSFYKHEKFDDDNEDNDDEEMKDIFDQNIRYKQTFGYVHSKIDILFTPKEVVQTKHISKRGIELIGFKAMNEEYLRYHVKKPLFVGSNAEASKAEKKFFASLINHCQQKKVIGICLMASRDDSSPCVFSMWPCEEHGGFYLYQVPFKESIRNLKDITRNYIFDEATPYSDSNLELMTEIVKKCRIKYDPALFENPNQTKTRTYIQAIALSEEYHPDSFVDTTLPDKNIMRQRLQKKDLITKFQEMFPAFNNETVDYSQKYMCYDHDQAAELIKGNLSRHTVPVLKSILKALDLSTIGLKNDLIMRIEDYKKTC
ncbi:hypothetical protein HCN44_008113 [Aphidius gifuensis]|uniref:SAP domain-containing protein n=1 Tax=Aphidius gifuensis TaxID=684658 RepID=A0A834XQ97_APHGI|nr:hypothetical protein HCN44_008113 [Aphidius gifuensis]